MNTIPKGPGALARKLAKIIGDVGKVKKTGWNSFHKYNYVTENALVYAVRDKLAEQGVMCFTSVEDQRHEVFTKPNGDQRLLVSVSLTHTFVDGDSGESFSVKSQGQAADNDDKGIYKATTGAMKYFLYKCFLIPTGDDPENDGPPGNDQRDDRQQDRGEEGDRQTREDIEASRAREQDRGGRQQSGPIDWRKVKIHFGAKRGVALGDMDKPQMDYWQAWKPRPFNGAIDPSDKSLRDALDVAAKELYQ